MRVNLLLGDEREASLLLHSPRYRSALARIHCESGKDTVKRMPPPLLTAASRETCLQLLETSFSGRRKGQTRARNLCVLFCVHSVSYTGCFYYGEILGGFIVGQLSKIRRRYFYMKKFRWFATLICVAVLALASVSLFGCGETVDGVKLVESKEKVVVIQATRTQGSLLDALNALKDAEELKFETTGSGEMTMIVSVDGYAPDSAKNEFWAIYTSLTELDGVSYSNEEYGTYEYDGKNYNSASYGCTGLPLVAGETYILAISTY